MPYLVTEPETWGTEGRAGYQVWKASNAAGNNDRHRGDHSERDEAVVELQLKDPGQQYCWRVVLPLAPRAESLTRARSGAPPLLIANMEAAKRWISAHKGQAVLGLEKSVDQAHDGPVGAEQLKAAQEHESGFFTSR